MGRKQGEHDRRLMLALAEFEYAEWDAGDEERRYEAEGRAAVSNFDFVDSVHDRFIECRFKQSTLGFTADALANCCDRYFTKNYRCGRRLD